MSFKLKNNNVFIKELQNQIKKTKPKPPNHLIFIFQNLNFYSFYKGTVCVGD